MFGYGGLEIIWTEDLFHLSLHLENVSSTIVFRGEVHLKESEWSWKAQLRVSIVKTEVVYLFCYTYKDNYFCIRTIRMRVLNIFLLLKLFFIKLCHYMRSDSGTQYFLLGNKHFVLWNIKFSVLKKIFETVCWSHEADFRINSNWCL